MRSMSLNTVSPLAGINDRRRQTSDRRFQGRVLQRLGAVLGAPTKEGCLWEALRVLEPLQGLPRGFQLC